MQTMAQYNNGKHAKKKLLALTVSTNLDGTSKKDVNPLISKQGRGVEGRGCGLGVGMGR